MKNTFYRRAGVWLLLIAIWEVTSKLFPAVPSASSVLVVVGRNLSDPHFLGALGGSLRRMAIGYAFVVLMGILGGLALGRVRILDEALGGLAVALNSIPGAAWVPFAIVIFGFNEMAVIFTVLLGATGIVMVNTSSGIRDVPPLILRAARTMGARGSNVFWHVIVPAAVPRIVDGLRLAWAFGWRALMAGELIVSSVHGMGQLLNTAAKARQLDELIGFMLVVALVGVLVDGLIFKQLEKSIRLRWGSA